MHPVLETIARRRSVRAYDPAPIGKEALSAVLEAAGQAATGCNEQPWRFVVVQDETLRGRFADWARPRYEAWLARAPEPVKKMREPIDAAVDDPVFYGAPAVVYVIGRGMTADFDCAMACGNLMLAARALGLGSCWVYFGQLILDVPEVRERLELAEGEKVYGPILLGRPRDGFPEAPPKRPLRLKIL